MGNAVTDFGNATGETKLPTEHWTTYLTLEAEKKPAFFKFMRRVALTEDDLRDQPEKSDEDFLRESVSNRSMAGIIYSLAKNEVKNPDDYTKPLPLDKILEAGIPIDICDPQGGQLTALHITAHNKELNANVAEILLNRGARINARDEQGKSPLSVAASFSWRVPLIKLLIERGADINNQDEKGRTPLSEAVFWQVKDQLFFKDQLFLDTIKIFVSHPNIDWTLPGNTQKPIEDLNHAIDRETDKGKELQLRAALSLIQEPLIAQLQQQLAQQQRLPGGPASAPTTLGDRAPS